MLDKIKSLFTNKYLGALDDTRNEIEKLQDYNHAELFGYGAVEWKQFDYNHIPSTTIRNQDGSSSCGAYALSKALTLNHLKETGRYKDLNPAFIYSFRANYPKEGMSLSDLMDISAKLGCTSNNALSYDGLNEKTFNEYKPTREEVEDAKTYRTKNYVYIDPKRVDTIYEVLEKGHTPIVLIRCLLKEWTMEPTLSPDFKGNNYEISHFVPIIYAGIKNGTKMFVIDDSWGSSFGDNGRRYVSADFITQRALACAYTIDLPQKPTKKFPPISRPLAYGLTNDKQVVILQDMLKEAGFLDKSIPSTGNYLNMTANAVYKFQVANYVDSLKVLQSLAGRRVGDKTIYALNRKFANED